MSKNIVSKKKLDTKNKKSKKKNLTSLSNISPQNQNMLEAKYCSCVQKVRKTLNKSNNNPYGICTSAVFGSRNSIRDRTIDCSKYYDYTKMNMKKLREIAREKKINKYSTLKKKELIKKLEKIN